MTFNLSQKHIDHGCRGNPLLCPVALAIEDKTGCCVRVGYVGVTILGHIFPLPKFVMEWIREYDDAVNVKPFEFEIAQLEQFRRPTI